MQVLDIYMPRHLQKKKNAVRATYVQQILY